MWILLIGYGIIIIHGMLLSRIPRKARIASRNIYSKALVSLEPFRLRTDPLDHHISYREADALNPNPKYLFKLYQACLHDIKSSSCYEETACLSTVDKHIRQLTGHQMFISSKQYRVCTFLIIRQLEQLVHDNIQISDVNLLAVIDETRKLTRQHLTFGLMTLSSRELDMLRLDHSIRPLLIALKKETFSKIEHSIDQTLLPFVDYDHSTLSPLKHRFVSLLRRALHLALDNQDPSPLQRLPPDFLLALADTFTKVIGPDQDVFLVAFYDLQLHFQEISTICEFKDISELIKYLSEHLYD